jgi:Zn-dependent M28 family amino/carboxypeptidase
VTFAGEEQGLFGSTFFANQAKQQGLNIAGMFSNDIIGSTLGQNGERDTKDVRLFAEGPPSNETAEEAALRRTMGSETTRLPASSPASSRSRQSEQCRR